MARLRSKVPAGGRPPARMKPEDVRAACIALFGPGMTLARYADRLAEVLDCHRRTVQDWFVHGVQGISAQAVRLALQTRFLEEENAKLRSRGGRRKSDGGATVRPEQFRFPV